MNVIKFPARAVNNGARDAIERWMMMPEAEKFMAAKSSALNSTDYFLAWLWVEGFKIVPHEQDTRPQKRR